MITHESAELQKLNPLVGHWRSEGEVLATSTTPAVRIQGTDTYEWVCDGKFVLHRVEVTIADEEVKVIEMIGYDAAAENYPMRSFDNHGTFTIMHSTVDGSGVWKISGEGIRSTLIIGKDRKTMKAHWERSGDGRAWTPWMEIGFTRLEGKKEIGK